MEHILMMGVITIAICTFSTNCISSPQSYQNMKASTHLSHAPFVNKIPNESFNSSFLNFRASYTAPSHDDLRNPSITHTYTPESVSENDYCHLDIPRSNVFSCCSSQISEERLRAQFTPLQPHTFFHEIDDSQAINKSSEECLSSRPEFENCGRLNVNEKNESTPSNSGSSLKTARKQSSEQFGVINETKEIQSEFFPSTSKGTCEKTPLLYQRS